MEFLVAGDRAHFLEMNTRLQVEHPVTEAVFGIDLVALQIRVAEGAALDAEPPQAQGHAIEARLYAEDPAHRWAPQTGTLHRLAVPDVRLDTGYADGDTIGVHYDPMLAKAVAHAPTRGEAIRKLASALERAEVHGPVTNRDLLVRSLRHGEFTAARMDTGFYERHLAELTEPAPDPYAALAAALADAQGRSRFGGWRNLPSPPQSRRFLVAGEEHEVHYRHTRQGLAADGVRVVHADSGLVVLEVDGVHRRFRVSRYGDQVYVGPTALTALPRFRAPTTDHAPGSLLAPMPGTVVRVAEGVTVGAAVEAGQPLLWLEAMKMEHRITAPAGGTLSALHASPGRQVEVGTLLAVVESARERTGEPREQPRQLHTRETDMSPAIETEEQRALRSAVAALGKRYGRDYLPPSSPRTVTPPNSGPRRPNWLSRRQPAGGLRRRRRGHSRTRHRARGTGRRGLSPAHARRLAGDLRHGHLPVRHGGAEAPLAAGPGGRHPHHGLRHHRTRRRLQLAPHHHHHAPATAPTGSSPAARCSSPASTSPTRP